MKGSQADTANNQLTNIIARLDKEIREKEKELQELDEKYNKAIRYQQEREQGIHNVLLAREVFSY